MLMVRSEFTGEMIDTSSEAWSLGPKGLSRSTLRRLPKLNRVGSSGATTNC
jgi:hypothetical protein